jgi:quercetin dioxygenase-like cupin family protein
MREIDREKVARHWASRGFTCDLWVDPPGQRWEDFVHEADELVLPVDGDLELEIDGELRHPKVGDELFIPAGARHSVRNIGSSTARWLYGYRIS